MIPFVIFIIVFGIVLIIGAIIFLILVRKNAQRANREAFYPVYTESNLIPVSRQPDDFEQSLQQLTGGIKDIAISPKTEQNLQALVNYYDPHRGMFTSWLRRNQSSGRKDFAAQISEESLEVIRQGHLLEDAVREGRVKETEFRMFLSQNALVLTKIKADNLLVINAQKDGFTLDNHQTIKTEGALSDIRVGEHEKKSTIDLDNKIKEAENTVRIGIINKFLSEHQKIFLIQELIDTCYKQIDEIRNSKYLPDTKQQMIEDRNGTIETFKQDMNARQARLLQANDGQEI